MCIRGVEGRNDRMEKTLDDSSYRAVYEKALERLQRQAPWWTHRELTDPGITLLELWALLADMQSFYLDQVQESHYRKYLKLLGICPDEGECARAWIFFDHVEEDCMIPRGTKLLADRMVFELEEDTALTSNYLTDFYQGDDRNRIDVMRMRRKSSFVLTEHKNRKNPLFTLGLKYAVGEGQEITFFVLLSEQDGRNPVAGEFFMARLAWEYRTKKGWRETEVVFDETRGLLYSGRICLRVDGEMTGTEKGYAIRCRIREGSYDVMPVLYKICLNTGRAIQRDTQCCEESFVLSSRQPRAVLQSYLAKTGEVQVFIRRGEERWEDITGDCDIDPPITAEHRMRCVRPAEKYLADKETEYRIVCYTQEMQRQYRPCRITGVTSQQLALSWQGIMKGQVKLMLRQGTGSRLYREYRQQEPEETRFDNAWHWQEGDIRFGDGRHGGIPEEAEDGLLLTSLMLYAGEEGNVAIGKIKTWENPELFGNITFRNMMAGRGGRDGKKPSDQFREAGELLVRENRLVTEEDICRLAVETPGLLIQRAQAEWRDGVTRVTIVPKKALSNRYCVKKYESETAKYLEQYRIAAGRLQIAVAGKSDLGGRED